MKKFTIFAILMALGMPVIAQRYTTPKRELRSAWVATVYGIDWPKASESAAQQQAAMTRMLDSLKNMNFNAVNFQVRSMCDAMYKSSYEPWSSYLTGVRGRDPGYDPLAFVVSECHARGMECHAWINPYRFSTGSVWATDKDTEAKGHLLKHGKYTVLDPAQQWTVDRIVNVCHEVVSNYDVDGILYDDYFYPNDIPCNSTAGDYQEYLDSGTKLSMADWRRQNVGKMVRSVYQMIQKTKPWVRFGISPAGVACTQQSLASQYGISPCPSGSDWQYNSIFSDPVSWLANKDLDFVSPQVYWKMGFARADYSKIVPWWCSTAKTFGRDLFVSVNIENLKTTDAFKEWALQVQMARDESPQDQAGVIFWSVSNLYKKSGASLQLGQYLKRTVYTLPALPPVMSWRNYKLSGNPQVSAIDLGNSQLLWPPLPQVRYSVYAVPCGVSADSFRHDVQYLLGMSYNPDDVGDDVVFDLPQDKRDGYRYAVCVMDRYGNEYAPVWTE